MAGDSAQSVHGRLKTISQCNLSAAVHRYGCDGMHFHHRQQIGKEAFLGGYCTYCARFRLVVGRKYIQTKAQGAGVSAYNNLKNWHRNNRPKGGKLYV